MAGRQLDAQLVELFVGVLERERLVFRHTDDEDLEAELATERRLHGALKRVAA